MDCFNQLIQQDVIVNDLTAWNQALVATRVAYAGMPEPAVSGLNNLIDEIMRRKQQLVEIAIAAGSAAICHECRGECCRYGKYYVTILDILACLKNGMAPPSPDFSDHPACPYGTSSGCSMAPGYRPMTCVVFNCQPVEEQMTPDSLKRFQILEKELRSTIEAADRLAGRRLSQPLLMSVN